MAAERAASKGDPFAAVDLAADERLSQLMRLSDKPRGPEFKARAPNRAPAAPLAPNPAAPPAPPIETAPAPAAAPATPEAVAPAAAAPAPAVVAEPPRAPVLRAIERSQPPFPPEVQREGVLSGRVIAAITVLPNGSVGQVDIVEASPPRVFDRTVRNTLLRWRFEPVPQPMRANVEIVFNAEQ